MLYSKLSATLKCSLYQCLQYNILGGKMNRGLAVPISYKLLAPVEEHTEENMKMANILGWCIELVSRQYNVEVLLLSQFIICIF